MKNKMINSWDTLPIGVFQKLYEIEQEKDENTEYRIIAALNSMTLEQVLDLPVSRVNGMAQEAAFLFEKPKKRKVQKSYVINGRKYEVTLNYKEMTTAQYIDFKNFAPECNKHLASFLTVFFVPEGHKYNSGYNVEFVAKELSDNLSVEDALSLSAFFFRKCKRLIRRTLLFSEAALLTLKWRMPKGMKEEKEQMEMAVGILKQMERSISISGLDLWRR